MNRRIDDWLVSVAQQMDFALDGAPIVDDSSAKRTNILLPSGGPAEFVVTTPPAGSFAQLVTRNYDTGPDGDKNPFRVIANVVSRPTASAASSIIPVSPRLSAGRRIDRLSGVMPDQRRKLYFSEDLSGGRQKYFGSEQEFDERPVWRGFQSLGYPARSATVTARPCQRWDRPTPG
jgi:hypothetical protein